jgi:hypothetical protein
MRATEVNVREYFTPLLGQSPWRARRGVGSFLTFEFGPKVKVDRHYRGKWRLWIYQAVWQLRRNGNEVVNSDAERRYIDLAVGRLEEIPLADVGFDASSSTTVFQFGDFRLTVKPADYLENRDERDHAWMLFMPDNKVLSVGPKGVVVSVESADRIPATRLSSK